MATLSVVVPVYNVEKYLRRCVDSILNQTYKDFELILVDDGSPDNCGEICDEYAKKDERVVVIHKANGGLSDARNAGLDARSNTKYISFVDSDDWLELNAFEVLVNKMQETNADIIYFNYYAVYKDNDKVFMNTTGDCKQSLEEIKNKIILDYWLNSVWDKFYRAEIIKDLRFPVGRAYEDAYFTPQVFDKVKLVICIKNGLYYYYKGNINSISYTHNSKKFLDIAMGWASRLNSITLTEYQKEYIETKIKKFLYNAFYLNQVDGKLTQADLNLLNQYIPLKEFYSGMLGKILGIYVSVDYLCRGLLKNNKFINKLWMQYKVGQ